MRRLLLGLVVTTAFAVSSGSALAHPPNHLHCLTTPSGNTHAIARGVTYHAPHLALENFHFHVHRPVFGVSGAGPMNTVGKHPLGPIPINLPFDPENPPC
jgi:hypothetical protein